MLLTGHGWCSSCELLDREVLQKPEFVREVSPNFVWVEFDFTFGDSEKESGSGPFASCKNGFWHPVFRLSSCSTARACRMRTPSMAMMREPVHNASSPA